MNKERRERIRGIISTIKVAAEEVEKVKDDEEFAYDNMPENLQYSMRGEDSQEAIEALDNALDQLCEAIDSLEEVL